MIIDGQIVFDVLISLIAALFGYLYSLGREEMREVKSRQAEVEKSIQGLAVEVPKSYARKEDLERALDDLKESLQIIQEDVKSLLKQRG